MNLKSYVQSLSKMITDSDPQCTADQVLATSISQVKDLPDHANYNV